MLRPEEVFAGKAFAKALGLPDGKEGADPPDLIFEIGGGLWAVEVTTLHQYLNRNGTEQSRAAFDSQADKLKERLSKNLSKEKGFRLWIQRWVENAEWRQIEDLAKVYIASERTDRFHLDNSELVWIERDDSNAGKIGLAKGILGVMQIPDEKGNICADVQATMNYAAARIVEDKGPKLGKLTGFDKVVLLIINDQISGYFFADTDNLKSALLKLNIPAFLKGNIYFIMGDEVNLVA